MKKLFLVLFAATAMVACNNSSDSTAEAKDSVDSVASEQKEAIDSTAEQKKDIVDSTADQKVDSLNKVDSAKH